MMNIYLANPRGFCAGVDRAIEIVNRALETFGAPVYVRHEVVHNKTVVGELREKGAVFVEELDDVPEGALVIFSAHGVSREVKREAERRNLRVFDATCPLVTKVHLEVQKSARENRETILIGHAGHPEVEGTLGQYEAENGTIYLVENEDDVQVLEVRDPENLAFVTQTTLSVDDTQAIIGELKRTYPKIAGPRKDDICYATQNRQDAVKELAGACDVVLVVGADNSSNSNRLRELAERLGCDAYLIDDERAIDATWFSLDCNIGVTSGASAPESVVQRVIAHLEGLGAVFRGEHQTSEENVEFSLPRELRRSAG